jgi:hypothetical protein
MHYIIAVGNVILEKNNEIKSSLEEFSDIQNSNSRAYDLKENSKNVEMDVTKIHHIPPFLWYAIDLYMKTIENCHASVIEDAIFTLIECSFKLNEEHW